MMRTKTGRTHEAKKPRPRDVIWDALVEACKINVPELTRAERGRVNKAVKMLRELEATPMQIAERAERYSRKWPEIELTATGLASNWSQFGLAQTKQGAATVRYEAVTREAVAAIAQRDAENSEEERRRRERLTWYRSLTPAEQQRAIVRAITRETLNGLPGNVHTLKSHNPEENSYACYLVWLHRIDKDEEETSCT